MTQNLYENHRTNAFFLVAADPTPIFWHRLHYIITIMSLLGALVACFAQPHLQQHSVGVHGNVHSRTAVLITVGSLADGTAQPVPENACQAVPASQEIDLAETISGGNCSLRSAFILANVQPREIAVTIMVRSGRIFLSAPLPALTGTVQVVGSIPRSLQPSAQEDVDNSSALVGQDDPETSEDGDPFYPHGDGRSGPSSAIGTVLDGRSQFQLLRTAVGSAVHLRTLRLENGYAMGEDAQSSAGGSIHSSGTLVLTNVAIRFSRALNGGGVYSDGPEFEVHQSILTRCEAARCGGCAYVALTGKAHFDASTLSFCHDQCGPQSGRIGNDDGRFKLPGAAGPTALPGRAAGAGGDPVGFSRAEMPGAAVDTSGAIAQGPPLVGHGSEPDRALPATV